MTEREVGLDVDTVFGTVPERHDLDASPAALGALLRRHKIRRALACSLRGARFDARAGNDETLAARCDELIPVGTVDTRDALAAEPELDRLVAAGVRVLRLFPVEQGAEPDFPGLRHIARLAADRDLTVLTGGDVRVFWRPFAGRGARVCFLDVHAYHVADFVLLARDEPGFAASTRLLNAPDSIERVAAEVGPHRLAYGSRAPLHEVSPSALRLRHAALDEDAWRLVAGGTAEAWL